MQQNAAECNAPLFVILEDCICKAALADQIASTSDGPLLGRRGRNGRLEETSGRRL